MDMALRKAQLLCEELKQEKTLAEQEVRFLKEKLRVKGMLPERDVLPQPSTHRDRRPRTASAKPRRGPPPAAVVVERNGERISPKIV